MTAFRAPPTLTSVVEAPDCEGQTKGIKISSSYAYPSRKAIPQEPLLLKAWPERKNGKLRDLLVEVGWGVVGIWGETSRKLRDLP